MRSFDEIFKAIQEGIDRIQDINLREKTQKRFDSIPRGIDNWKIKSYSGNLRTELPATVKLDELENAYRQGASINGGSVGDSNSIDFDIYYRLKESQPNGDLGLAQIYEINAYNNGSGFDIQTFDTDNRKCRDEKGNRKQGTYKTDTSFSFDESRLGKHPFTTIRESMYEYGINEKLEGENHISKTETIVEGGKITKIVNSQILEGEGKPRKERTRIMKSDNGVDFEKTTKIEETRTLQSNVENVKFQPGESVDISKKGTQVIEVQNDNPINSEI